MGSKTKIKYRTGKIFWRMLSVLAVVLALAGCGGSADPGEAEETGEQAGSVSEETREQAGILPEGTPGQTGTDAKETPEQTDADAEGTREQNGTNPEETPQQTQTAPEETRQPPIEVQEPRETEYDSGKNAGRLVAIDAGHQAKGNSEKEPIGPGAQESKAKVASGTRGCVSGLNEYELTLAVSEKLAQELENRGYQVLMVRTSHDVDISNAERAQKANEAGADVFVRVHANGSDNAGVQGVETLCQTKDNPYNASFYEDSRALSEQVLDGVVNAAGAVKRHVVETDTMSGINWCQVPVTIVEVGFMTNEEEDALMATEEYQQKLAQGIADGIDAYFAAKE